MALLQSDTLLKLLEEIQDYAIILLDKDGNVQNWNRGAERIKGYTAEEIVGKNFRQFYTPVDQEQGLPAFLLKIAMERGRAIDEGWRVRKDGTRFWGSITITAIHDEAGAVIAFGKVTRDLTELRKAEKVKALEIRNKELEQFNYIASHDLQEPLRTITSYIEVLKEDYMLPEEVTAHLTTIDNAASRMKILIKGLLDYSRLGRKSKTEQINCSTLVH